MNNRKEVELEVIKRFVTKEKRPRLLALMKDRIIGEGFGYLDHFTNYLDMRFFKKVPSMSMDREFEFILNEIKQQTSDKRCYVMSADKNIDGKEMDLNQALYETMGKGFGSFLILEKGTVVYYENEEMQERYIGTVMGG